MLQVKHHRLPIACGAVTFLKHKNSVYAALLAACLALPAYAQTTASNVPSKPEPSVQAHMLIDQLIAQQEARQAAVSSASAAPSVSIDASDEPAPVSTPVAVNTPVVVTPTTSTPPTQAQATAPTPLPVARRTPHSASIVRVAVPARRPFQRGYSNSVNQQAHMLAEILHSRVAFVMDQTTGKTLLNKNGRYAAPIASITKLMTAVITLDANLPMDEMITITEADIDTIKRSRSRLAVGTTLSRQELLHLSLMSSENRAAHALGRSYPGGMPAAIRAMNRRAVMLGMRDTRYVEPTGLSSQNQSSARDLALLVRAAYRYPLIRNYTTYPLAHFPVNGKMLRYNNTNRLVHSIDWDIGLQKTGFISEAGRCVVMQSTIAGRNIIIVLLDSPNNNRRAEDADAIRYFVQNELGSSGWSRTSTVAGVY